MDTSGDEIVNKTIEVTTVTPAPYSDAFDNGLTVSVNDPSSFLVNNQLVKVKEATTSISSIVSLKWIDKIRVAVTASITPDMDFFTIYNTKDKDFEYSLYGTNFVWENNNIRSLVYIECPPLYVEDEDATYKVHDFFGGTLYESPTRILDLKYKNGTIYFKVLSKDGSTTSKSISQ